MALGSHVASLNLFREADGTYRITVAGASADELLFIAELRGDAKPPIVLLVAPILEAAQQFAEDWRP